MPQDESALVVLVPEAEAAVGPFRIAYDPSAAAGCPAHITLLYPFRPPDEIGPAVLDGLRRCLGPFGSFPYTLNAPSRFPGVLYLAPDPAEPFRQLTLAIWARHPDLPPYGGRHADIVPHLSIAQLADEAALERVAAAFARAAGPRLPIHARADAVALLALRGGRWRTRATLALDEGRWRTA